MHIIVIVQGGGCGDTHENQVFCITHNVSPNVDIIHYSWTYFEKGGAEVQRESLIRWGQRMEHRPMVHHLVARGKANTCEGDNEQNVRLNDVYAKFGYNAFCIQTGLYAGGYDYDKDEEMGIKRCVLDKKWLIYVVDHLDPNILDTVIVDLDGILLVMAITIQLDMVNHYKTVIREKKVLVRCTEIGILAR